MSLGCSVLSLGFRFGGEVLGANNRRRFVVFGWMQGLAVSERRGFADRQLDFWPRLWGFDRGMLRCSWKA